MLLAEPPAPGYGALDMAATNHFVPNTYQGGSHHDTPGALTIGCANGSAMEPIATDVLDLPCDFLPRHEVPKLCDNGWQVLFTKNNVEVIGPARNTVLEGTLNNTVAFFPNPGMPQTSPTDRLLMILQDLKEVASKPHPPIPYAAQGTEINEALQNLQDLLQLGAQSPISKMITFKEKPIGTKGKSSHKPKTQPPVNARTLPRAP
eukprot:jgi/Psemu1/44471/gm1.44471_g